jgi:molybdate transport system substrate-binding protein
VWARRDGNIDVARGLAVLADPRIHHVAIANPQRAPYGRAAVAALRKAQLYDAVEKKLVQGDNISQAAQLAESGNADAGILSLSLVRGPALRASGTYVEVPLDLYPPIEQAAIVVRATRQAALAREFIAHLQRPDTREELSRFGLTPPRAPAR